MSEKRIKMSENNENNLILKTSLLLEKNYAGLKITKASLKKINGNECVPIVPQFREHFPNRNSFFLPKTSL